MFQTPCNRACTTLKPAFLATFIGILTGSATIAPALAQSNTKVTNYSRSGSWQIVQVHNGTRFSHCSAGAQYKSGTRVGIVALSTGLWRLSFYHANWPERTGQRFQTRVVVDGREVLSTTGQFNRKSALIDLGRSADRIQALMRGNIMSVETPSGKSSFRLDGSRAATGEVARCWAANTRGSAGGAFGSAPSGGSSGGAFGTSPPRGGAFGGSSMNQSGATKLSRADTMELATRYLGNSSVPYEILPVERNVMRHFPVNWRYRSGALGGMMAVRGASTTTDAILGKLLGEQAGFCKGSNASQREQSTYRDGRPVVRGASVCSQSGSVVRTVFSVWTAADNTMLIVIEAGVTSSGTQSGTAQGSPTPRPGRQDNPKPNEI